MVVVRFTEPSNAYQALSVLKQCDAEGRIALGSAAVVERMPTGELRIAATAETTAGSLRRGGRPAPRPGRCGGSFRAASCTSTRRAARRARHSSVAAPTTTNVSSRVRASGSSSCSASSSAPKMRPRSSSAWTIAFVPGASCAKLVVAESMTGRRRPRRSGCRTRSRCAGRASRRRAGARRGRHRPPRRARLRCSAGGARCPGAAARPAPPRGCRSPPGTGAAGTDDDSSGRPARPDVACGRATEIEALKGYAGYKDEYKAGRKLSLSSRRRPRFAGPSRLPGLDSNQQPSG